MAGRPRIDARRRVGLWAGPVLALSILLFADLDPGNPLVTRAAAVATLMAVWWITEAIPIPATALLPVAFFPLLGIQSGKATAATYFNSIIFLFIGGFIVALAMQKWDLHRRIALRIVSLIGASPRRLLLGFMMATAFLSMWISNTAATMMMVPIALAVSLKLKESGDPQQTARFATGLLIGVAYSSSIGGIATIIGTPPNLDLARIFTILYPNAPEITFARWIVFGLPCSIVLLASAWLVLNFVFLRGLTTVSTDRSVFARERESLGRMKYEEKIVLFLFALLAFCWLLRRDIVAGSLTIPGWSRLFPAPGFIDDGTVAIGIALILFLIPSRSKPGTRLMDWRTASGLHWGIVILFGGGFALATGFTASGLSQWLAGNLTGLGNVPPILLVAIICTMLTFLTELTSNTATTQMVLPILGALAVAIDVHPLLLMIPATLSASCAFMLPVATPPNAIVFGSGEVRMSDMKRSGLIMNLVGVVLITTLMYLVGLPVFGIDPGVVPDWASMP